MCVVNVNNRDKGGPQRVNSVTEGTLLYETDYAYRDIAVLHFRLPGMIFVSFYFFMCGCESVCVCV